MSDAGSGAPVVVIGAGPAGLTAALELIRRDGAAPIVLEADTQVGGISKTVAYKGNRMDIGGHRFFSKSSAVMDWWLAMMPLQGAPSRDDVGLGRTVPLSDAPAAPDPEREDRVMLSRSRLSRIYFLRRFFDYPVSLTWRTLSNIGLGRTLAVGSSYVAARLRPVRPEISLEDFMVNRFGRKLYELFFRDYTEKVWGVPCDRIGREWGAQRIKGLSVGKAISHAVSSMFRRDDSIAQDGTETTLIGRFLYPKHGPGQLWELVADRVTAEGGEIRLRSQVTRVRIEDGRVRGVTVRDLDSGEECCVETGAVLSSMPLRDLVRAASPEAVPARVREVAEGLPYRDFVTCGLLVRKLAVTGDDGGPIRDNWIYVQERDVRLGRLQVFNNWSPYMVADPSLTWVGLEYFCDEGDALWSMPDAEFAAMAAGELEHIGIISAEDVVDSTVLRVRKAYPAYFGTYAEVGAVREWIDGIEGLYVMGRNGMHRYNNMDHSMLSAMAAVDALAGRARGDAVWRVNAEEDYHEDARGD